MRARTSNRVQTNNKLCVECLSILSFFCVLQVWLDRVASRRITGIDIHREAHAAVSCVIVQCVCSEEAMHVCSAPLLLSDTDRLELQPATQRSSSISISPREERSA